MTTSSQPPASPRPFSWIPVLVMLALTGIVFGSIFWWTPSQPAEVELVVESWWYPWTWWGYGLPPNVAEAMTNERTLEKFRRHVGAFAQISALAYLAVYFFGAPVVERIRSSVARRLRLSTTAQRDLAVAAFTTVCGLVMGTTLFIHHFQYAKGCSIVLLAGSAYPFLMKVLPGISHENKELRMSGIRDIKAILTVLAIILIAFQILNGGIGGLTVNPPATPAN